MDAEQPQPNASRQMNGRWQKGHSGNPAGRPVGSRNRAMLLAEALFEGEAEAIVRATVTRAKAGNVMAAKLCLERLLPRRQSRPVILELPPTDDAAGVAAAIETVIRAASTGAIDLEEAFSYVGLLQAKANALQAEELERRVAALEAAQDAAG